MYKLQGSQDHYYIDKRILPAFPPLPGSFLSFFFPIFLVCLCCLAELATSILLSFWGAGFIGVHHQTRQDIFLNRCEN